MEKSQTLEQIKPSDITIRYHHINKWVKLIKLTGIVIDDPKTYPNPEQLKEILLQESVEFAQYHISNYKKVQRDIKMWDRLIETFNLIPNKELVECLLDKFYEIMMISGYGGYKVRILSSNFILKFLSDNIDKPYEDCKNNLIVALNEIEDKLCRYREEINQNEDMSRRSVDMSFLHMDEEDYYGLSPLVTEFVEYFYGIEDKKITYLFKLILTILILSTNNIILFGKDMVISLKNISKFENFLTEHSEELNYKKTYIEDLIGTEVNINAEKVKFTINRFFLNYYKFFRTAILSSEQDVIFTFNPDIICESCKGGENKTGDHCTRPRMSQEDSEDATVRNDILSVISENTEMELDTKFRYDTKGRIIEIRLPIKHLFNKNFLEKFRLRDISEDTEES